MAFVAVDTMAPQPVIHALAAATLPEIPRTYKSGYAEAAATMVATRWGALDKPGPLQHQPDVTRVLGIRLETATKNAALGSCGPALAAV